MVPKQVWIAFTTSDGSWVGNTVHFFLKHIFRQKSDIIHTNLVIEFESGETYVIDYSWSGITIHLWDESIWKGITKERIPVGVSPVWVMDVVAVLYAIQHRAHWHTFATWPFKDKKPFVCTSFVELATGREVTGASPENLLAQMRWELFKEDFFNSLTEEKLHNYFEGCS